MCTMQPRFEALWKVLAMEYCIAQLDGDERGVSDLERGPYRHEASGPAHSEGTPEPVYR